MRAAWMLVVSAAWLVRSAAAEEPGEAEPEEAIDVVVRGAPIEAARERTAAVYVLRKSALDAPGETLGEALSTVPGVRVQRSGGAADLATASLRGASSAQSPVYLAGIRLNDELTGTADLATLPLWMLHRAEVYRGHAPAGLDELGMGGAVLLEPRIPRGTGARAAFGAGSFGAREGRAALSFGERRAGAIFALRHARGRGDYDFVDDRGTRFDESDDRLRPRENADHQETDAWSLARLSFERGRVVTLLHVFTREGGAPGLQLPGARRARASQARLLGGASADVACPESAPDGCRLEIGAEVLATRYRLLDPLGELGGARDVASEGQRFGQRLRARVPIVEELELGFGGLQQVSALAVDAGAAPSVRARRHHLRASIDGRARAGERVELALLTALECHSTAAGASGDTCGVLEPVARAGARIRLAEPLDLLGNVGRYVRVPTLGELHGVSATVQGNAALETEQGISADLGLSAQWREAPVALFAQLFGFARFADRLIAYRRASLGSLRPYNAQSARLLGAELGAGLSLFDRAFARLALTALDPRDTSDDRSAENDLLPYQARLAISPEIELVSPRWPLLSLDRASVAARYRYESERVADPAGLVVLAAHHRFDLEAALAFVQHLALRARVANVLDQRAYDLVGYPLPGRSYHALLEAWW